jgi:Sulfotransferase family
VGKSLAALDMLDYGDDDTATPPKAIVAATGKDFIVDSSKLPKRLSYLMRLKEIDVYPVHLVRDPKGQINSVVRKHGGFLKHIFRYELVHEQIRQALHSVPHSVVHYEDLVRDPAATLKTILEPLGLSFDPRQLAWAEAEKHEIAGNYMRFDDTSELVLDEGWRKSLSPLRRRAIDFGTLISRQTLPKTGPVR